MKTSKPLLTLRMLFPAAVSLIVLLLGEWIARGSLTADTFISFIFPHFGAYLLAWLLLFLVWELLDWVLRIPPLATLGMAVLGCAPCAVNFYTMQLRGEPFLPWDLMQVWPLLPGSSCRPAWWSPLCWCWRLRWQASLFTVDGCVSAGCQGLRAPVLRRRRCV